MISETSMAATPVPFQTAAKGPSKAIKSMDEVFSLILTMMSSREVEIPLLSMGPEPPDGNPAEVALRVDSQWESPDFTGGLQAQVMPGLPAPLSEAKRSEGCSPEDEVEAGRKVNDYASAAPTLSASFLRKPGPAAGTTRETSSPAILQVSPSTRLGIEPGPTSSVTPPPQPEEKPVAPPEENSVAALANDAVCFAEPLPLPRESPGLSKARNLVAGLKADLSDEPDAPSVPNVPNVPNVPEASDVPPENAKGQLQAEPEPHRQGRVAEFRREERERPDRQLVGREDKDQLPPCPIGHVGDVRGQEPELRNPASPERPTGVFEPRRVAAELFRESLRDLPRSVEIRLDPPHLGKVTVLLSARGEDVAVRFVASTKEAGLAISQATPDLVKALSEQGLVLTGATVDSGQSHRSPEWYAAKGARKAARKAHDDVGPVFLPQNPYRLLTRSATDYFA